MCWALLGCPLIGVITSYTASPFLRTWLCWGGCHPSWSSLSTTIVKCCVRCQKSCAPQMTHGKHLPKQKTGIKSVPKQYCRSTVSKKRIGEFTDCKSRIMLLLIALVRFYSHACCSWSLYFELNAKFNMLTIMTFIQWCCYYSKIVSPIGNLIANQLDCIGWFKVQRCLFRSERRYKEEIIRIVA